eukprot:gene8864-biopygen7484
MAAISGDEQQSGIGRNLHVRTEQLVANIKAFAAEGLAYLETQFDVEDSADNSGRPIPLETAVAFVRARLAQPDVVATGLVAVPDIAGTSFPMMSYSHGTVYEKTQVPSFPDQSPETQLAIAQLRSPVASPATGVQ